MSPARVFLGLGANLGDRAATLASACRALQAGGVSLRARSGLYLTEPVGGPPQDWYLNAVVEGQTMLSPRALLALALEVERAHGRVRGERNAARTLDVDVLLYADLVFKEPGLELPHPRLHERRFVLVPLAEIAGELVHPRLGRTVAAILHDCADRAQVVPAGTVAATP